ncbi:hypothetical protein [Limnobacter sp.]|uniref:hypothetical protein n=1 Tax=Limnobacter sp. TaxID=2003368 RepID=UPI00258E65F1|nr:hypothetical protein [Limnobacter sp.]
MAENQVVGNVSQIEGEVDVQRDGKTIALKAGDAVRVGDVVTATASGHASITVTNSAGEPVGNLVLSPNGSVLADLPKEAGQEGFVFQALTPDGVALSDVDPDYAQFVQLQGGEGGMFGLFGAAGLLGGSSAAAVGGGALGVGFLAAAGGSGSGSDGASGSAGGSVSTPDNGGPINNNTGTTNTPLDAVVDPVLSTLNTTPLNVVSVPLGDALSSGSDALMSALPIDLSGGGAGGVSGGITGTPLDTVLDPALGTLNASPLGVVTQPLTDAISMGADTLMGGLSSGGLPSGLPMELPGTGGTSAPVTGTPLDAVLSPVLGALNSSPLSVVTQPLTDALSTGAHMLTDGGLPSGLPTDIPGAGSTTGTTGTPLDAVVDPVLNTLNNSPLGAATQPVSDALHTVASALSSGSSSLPSPSGLPIDTSHSPVDLGSVTSSIGSLQQAPSADSLTHLLSGHLPV